MIFDIKYAKNGYVLNISDPGDPELNEIMVFEESDTSEVQAFASCLHAILDSIGPSTSRYSKERIYIDIRPGDKHDDYKDFESDDSTTA
jgi:hypothetical protein